MKLFIPHYFLSFLLFLAGSRTSSAQDDLDPDADIDPDDDSPSTPSSGPAASTPVALPSGSFATPTSTSFLTALENRVSENPVLGPAGINPCAQSLSTRPFIHGWVGSYYNGTLTLTSSVNSESSLCSAQLEERKSSYVAVLSVFSPLENSDTKEPFAWALAAWLDSDSGDVERRAWPESGNGLPTAVQVAFASVQNLWKPKEEHKPVCSITELEKHDDRYDFSCNYTSGDRPDRSDLLTTLPNCHTPRPAPLLLQHSPYANTSLTASFSGRSAELNLKSRFLAAFGNRTMMGTERLDAQGPGTLVGDFELSFQGQLDGRHSHELRTGGDEPEWRAVAEKMREYRIRNAGPCEGVYDERPGDKKNAARGGKGTGAAMVAAAAAALGVTAMTVLIL